ncbi:hypothetical protein JI747_001900 [Chryseobacterium sp. RG1]|uniref:SprB repeat-containing protein n=1 Tax=Chryseobacterium tagetis TaxID=2801334 RepID=A0ABS7ZXJ1_9FLAO|nr:hypothetical protein [Chryseobacterium tagetis]MCA6065912.1 hypothetical protein [Chryseobacterium tagetis]
MKKILYILTLFLPLVVFSQVTVNVTTAPDTCGGTGSAAYNIDGATVGAEFDFVIYKLPDTTTPYRTTTDIQVTSASFTYNELNLPAGSYNLVAYHRDGASVTPVNTSFTVASNFTAIAFSLSQAYVCSGSAVTVNVSAGSPATYELRTTANTVVIAPQASNVLTPVSPGTYNVIVTDTCGNTTSLGITVTAENFTGYEADRSVGLPSFSIMSDCNTIHHTERLKYNNDISAAIPAHRFPINVEIIIDNPLGGANTVINQVWTSNADNNSQVNIPFYEGYTYNYEVTFTDACGIVYSKTDAIAAIRSFDLISNNATCGTKYLAINGINYQYAPVEVTFSSYPSGFDPANFNTDFIAGTYTHTYASVPASISFGSSSTSGLPEGNYTVTMTSCGTTITKSVTVQNTAVMYTFDSYTLPGCGNSEGSAYIRTMLSTGQVANNPMTNVMIISAPAAFATNYGVLPYNASAYIASNGNFYMNSLPAGNYTIQVTGTCGNVQNTSFTIAGADIQSPTVTVVNHCGSFDVTSSIYSNLVSETFYLQKYYPASGQWGHPTTGALYTNGAILSTTTGILMNNANTTLGYATATGLANNVTASGEFRVIVESQVYGNASAFNTYCRDVINTFTVDPNFSVTLRDYYVVSCADNTYNLVIDAAGAAPFVYEIIEKDGVVVSVNNGSDPVFTGLTNGLYKVRISDACGNSVIVTALVVQNKLPKIQMSPALCEGSNSSLYVDGLSFLTVTWFKNGVNTGVTGNVYNFTPFTAADYGTYSAVLSYEPNTNDCINNTLSITLDSSLLTNPNAGTGQTVTINSNTLTGAPIDLFTYLTGSPNTYGEWTETTNPSSGLLVDHNWYGALAAAGTYTFTYTVNGMCSGSDTSQVTIIVTGTCTQPGNTTGTGNPTKVGISLHQTRQIGWPENINNGYLTLESNTKGFVITRVQNSDTITDPKEGMIIYDIDAACVKLYNGSTWNCIQRSCNN